MAKAWRIPLAAPDLGAEEIAAVTRVLQSGMLSRGPYQEELESAFARYLGRRHAIGVNSGTSGLHLALLAARVAPGDLVLTTPLSFIASSNCILHCRATPVFVDVDPQTGNLDEAQALQAMGDLAGGGTAGRRWLPPLVGRSRRLKAVLPVHLFGQQAPLGAIVDSAGELGVAVIEDACEALGARRQGRLAGGWGDAAVFGFYANKQITMGEGGLVVTDHEDWAERIRHWRNQHPCQPKGGCDRLQAGFSYRLDEMSAALGLTQLKRLESLLAMRREVARLYQDHLGEIEGVELLKPSAGRQSLSWFVYLIRVRRRFRDVLIERLAQEGIPAKVYFPPIHLQEPFRSLLGYREGAFPVAEEWGATALALPFFPRMAPEQVAGVCRTVREVVTSSG